MLSNLPKSHSSQQESKPTFGNFYFGLHYALRAQGFYYTNLCLIRTTRWV
jgi:hypothetical protein